MLMKTKIIILYLLKSNEIFNENLDMNTDFKKMNFISFFFI